MALPAPISPRGGRRDRFLRLTLPFVCCAIAALWVGAVRAQAAASVHAYELRPPIHAVVAADGSVTLLVEQGGVAHTLLRIEPPLFERRRTGDDDPDPFTGLFSEGAPGGRRGFARDADDDGDGVVDEDPANGRDDDGDGLVDEDFAAVSDVMAVVDRTSQGRLFHLETYHWSHVHLRPSLMMEARLSDRYGAGREGLLACTLASGQWYDGGLTWRCHGRVTRPETHAARLLVATIPHPARTGEEIWIGISPLDAPGEASGRQARLRLAGELLEVPLVEGRRTLAIAVAPTLLQLRAALGSAHAVRLGAGATARSAAVPWIVPPLCPTCRQGEIPEISWEAGPDDTGRLVCRVRPDQNALLDPDLFVLDDQPLGPPREILWRPDEAQEDAVQGAGTLRIAWRSWTPSDLASHTEAQLDPYLTLPGFHSHLAAGELTFVFPRRPERQDAGVAPLLRGACLGGHAIQLPLPSWVESVEPAAAETGTTLAEGDVQQKISEGRNQPILAPELLSNFPNPFQDQTQIHFRVPATVGEGFVWEDGEEPLLDPASPIPYRSSPPLVTLKIYSLSGTEIATLEVGYLDVGEYRAGWDGTDTLGRPVASGTYFCKLQIEDWAVTKRVVYLR
jgi:hypothetical protein